MATEPRPITHRAPCGRATWVMRLLLLALVIGVTTIALTNLALPRLATYALISAPVLILLATIPFMIFGYEMRDQTLVVKRLGWTTQIPLAGLKDAEADPKAMHGSIRIFGNGGLFAFNGIFWNREL